MIFIYKVTSPSNKTYIGITHNLAKRKAGHYREANCPNVKGYTYKFKRAIRKYQDNLTWNILNKTNTYEKAHLLEKAYIKEYDSYKNGYNMTLGGDGNSKDFLPYKWTKDKIVLEAQKYNNIPEWNEKSRNSYLAAKRFDKQFFGLFEECSAHMSTTRKRPSPSNFKWSKDKVLKEAMRYKTLKEFKEECSSAYSAMHRYKKENHTFYIKCTGHMRFK